MHNVKKNDKLNYLKHKYAYSQLSVIHSGGGLKNKKHYTNMTSNTFNLSEPWFSLISLGLKTIEGRKNKGAFKAMAIGDVLTWTNDDFESRSVATKVIRKTIYKTFDEYLESEGLDKCLPGMPSLKHGLSVYHKYFPNWKEDEKEFGVVAIELELIK